MSQIAPFVQQQNTLLKATKACWDICCKLLAILMVSALNILVNRVCSRRLIDFDQALAISEHNGNIVYSSRLSQVHPGICMSAGAIMVVT
jgi:hypothetical protein